jgi:hypothetical protein
MRIPIFLLAAAVMIVGPLASRSLAQGSPEQREASYEAHKGDFDYLLGDWEFTSVSQEWGKGGGYWTAVRVGEGALILDEYRVVGDSGQTWVVINTLRAWNAVLEQWDLVSIEKATGLQDLGTGRRVGAEMHIIQKFGALTATPTVWRIRYYDIGPDRFYWRGDRSTDDGKTWQMDFLKIEARRIGPPRSMTALTSAATRRNPR